METELDEWEVFRIDTGKYDESWANSSWHHFRFKVSTTRHAVVSSTRVEKTAGGSGCSNCISTHRLRHMIRPAAAATTTASGDANNFRMQPESFE